MSGILARLTRPQGDNLSYTKVSAAQLGSLEYEVIRIDALYFLAASADANLPAYHQRLLKEQQKLVDLSSNPKVSPDDLQKQKNRCAALKKQYRHLSRAARHYMHYRMYQNALALQNELLGASDEAKIEVLVSELKEYIRRFERTGFKSYLRFEQQKESEAFGPASCRFVMLDAEGRPFDLSEQHVPTDLLDPGLKIFGIRKPKEEYLKHLYAIHQNPDLPVEARILFKHLNDFQAKNAVKVDADEQSAETGAVFVEVVRPATPTQKWVGRLGLLAGTTFSILGAVGIFAAMAALLPVGPAIAIAGLVGVIDILRNKDDFYDQLLRFSKQYELNHPYKTGFHYRGLMEKRSGRMLLSLFLRTLVGFEFFAVAVPGGIGLVDNGRGVANALFNQLKLNGTWLQLLNPLFYVAAITCVLVSFFVPATAWADYWGLHLDDVKPEHQFDVSLAQKQADIVYKSIARGHASGSHLAIAQEQVEIELEGLGTVESLPEPITVAAARLYTKGEAVAYDKSDNRLEESVEKKDALFEAKRVRPAA